MKIILDEKHFPPYRLQSYKNFDNEQNEIDKNIKLSFSIKNNLPVEVVYNKIKKQLFSVI